MLQYIYIAHFTCLPGYTLFQQHNYSQRKYSIFRFSIVFIVARIVTTVR